MKRITVLLLLATLLFAALPAVAQKVAVDYDHHVDFGKYHTFSIVSVQTESPLWNDRVRRAIRDALTAKGYTPVPGAGGDMSIVAVSTTHARPTLETFYTGLGGWHWRGFGTAETTVHYYRVGTLVVSIFDTPSMRLIWRGYSSGVLAHKADKNIRNLNKAVRKMFQHFPPTME